jgi:hypothetical protein
MKRERPDGADAFIPESAQISGTSDDLAELLAEHYLREASGDDSEEGARDDLVSEEVGGPFVETSPDEEYGPTKKGKGSNDTAADGNGPLNARPTRNATPQAVSSLAIAAPDEDADDESVERDLNIDLGQANSTALHSISGTIIGRN